MVYFGFKKDNDKGEVVNDFILKETDDKKHLEEDSLFMIYFNKELGKYYFQSTTKNVDYYSFVDLTSPYVSLVFEIYFI